ncbi:MAG TPA: Bax inhibitor-1/YccA family protein [Rhodanobacteraceae bacterium]
MPLRTNNPLRSSNPALRSKVFQNLPATTGEPMTINGTLARTGLLLLLMLITGTWTWMHFMAATAAANGNLAAGANAVTPFLIGGVILGLVFAFAGAFKPNWSPITAPLYALAEGTALGGISAMYAVQYHGIVLQAILASVGVLVAMLVLYRTGVIKVTQKFRTGVTAATFGILLLYLVSWGLSAFTHVNTSILFGGGTISILISIFVVCIAALNLVLDFDLIEQANEAGAPKYMEWYCAFALMVTLVWLYLELLRLLANTRR